MSAVGLWLAPARKGDQGDELPRCSIEADTGGKRGCLVVGIDGGGGRE